MASSIDAIPAKKLEELLECSFCLETLNDPRTLPCFHSFCKCCLEKFVQGQGNRDENPDKGIKNFECPICRSEFTVDPKEGAAGIGTNYFIRNMLDVMEVESRVKGIPCPHCKNPSVARCVTCEFFLCEKCLEGHNNYLGFQKHSVLSMDELSEPENRFKIRGTPRCQEHDDALKHFCETCEELICRDCKDYNHNNHKCSPLKKAAEQKTEELNTHYQKLTEEVTEVNKALEAMKGVDKSLEDNVKTAKQKIGARKEAILEAVRRNLDEKEKSLLREIDIIYLFKHEAIEEQLKDTEAYVKTIQNSVDMCAGLLKNGNPVEIASSHKLLCTNIENVRKERPENLKPDNDGGIPFNSSPMDGLDAEIEKISQRMGNIKSTEAGRAWCFNTSNKLRVVIYQGNIIKEDADIIVSSCDSKLSHARGVSLAIANAGGPSIRKESNEYLEKHAGVLASGNVATIGPGLLKCKKILLGVSPYWEKHGKDGSIKRIRQVLGQIFQTASTLKAKSVAMPAIGSGLCGMPKDVCAQTLLSFFKELGDQNLTSNIKRPFEIRLVDIEKTTIDVLVKKFTNGCLKK